MTPCPKRDSLRLQGCHHLLASSGIVTATWGPALISLPRLTLLPPPSPRYYKSSCDSERFTTVLLTAQLLFQLSHYEVLNGSSRELLRHLVLRPLSQRLVSAPESGQLVELLEKHTPRARDRGQNSQTLLKELNTTSGSGSRSDRFSSRTCSDKAPKYYFCGSSRIGSKSGLAGPDHLDDDIKGLTDSGGKSHCLLPGLDGLLTSVIIKGLTDALGELGATSKPQAPNQTRSFLNIPRAMIYLAGELDLPRLINQIKFVDKAGILCWVGELLKGDQLKDIAGIVSKGSSFLTPGNLKNIDGLTNGVKPIDDQLRPQTKGLIGDDLASSRRALAPLLKKASIQGILTLLLNEGDLSRALSLYEIKNAGDLLTAKIDEIQGLLGEVSKPIIKDIAPLLEQLTKLNSLKGILKALQNAAPLLIPKYLELAEELIGAETLLTPKFVDKEAIKDLLTLLNNAEDLIEKDTVIELKTLLDAPRHLLKIEAIPDLKGVLNNAEPHLKKEAIQGLVGLLNNAGPSVDKDTVKSIKTLLVASITIDKLSDIDLKGPDPLSKEAIQGLVGLLSQTTRRIFKLVEGDLKSILITVSFTLNKLADIDLKGLLDNSEDLLKKEAIQSIKTLLSNAEDLLSKETDQDIKTFVYAPRLIDKLDDIKGLDALLNNAPDLLKKDAMKVIVGLLNNAGPLDKELKNINLSAVLSAGAPILINELKKDLAGVLNALAPILTKDSIKGTLDCMGNASPLLDFVDDTNLKAHLHSLAPLLGQPRIKIDLGLLDNACTLLTKDFVKGIVGLLGNAENLLDTKDDSSLKSLHLQVGPLLEDDADLKGQDLISAVGPLLTKEVGKLKLQDIISAEHLLTKDFVHQTTALIGKASPLLDNAEKAYQAVCLDQVGPLFSIVDKADLQAYSTAVGPLLKEVGISLNFGHLERVQPLLTKDSINGIVGLLDNAENLLTSVSQTNLESLISKAGPLITSVSKLNLEDLLRSLEPLLKMDSIKGKLDLEGIAQNLLTPKFVTKTQSLISAPEFVDNAENLLKEIRQRDSDTHLWKLFPLLAEMSDLPIKGIAGPEAVTSKFLDEISDLDIKAVSLVDALGAISHKKGVKGIMDLLEDLLEINQGDLIGEAVPLVEALGDIDLKKLIKQLQPLLEALGEIDLGDLIKKVKPLLTLMKIEGLVKLVNNAEDLLPASILWTTLILMVCSRQLIDLLNKLDTEELFKGIVGLVDNAEDLDLTGLVNADKTLIKALYQIEVLNKLDLEEPLLNLKELDGLLGLVDAAKPLLTKKIDVQGIELDAVVPP
ncbi:hypothetical protein CEK25_007815 [Fusarium fujikuroi]|nr:hypothetical protein CEK25_007815 [Fusarium fujikuroi]